MPSDRYDFTVSGSFTDGTVFSGTFRADYGKFIIETVKIDTDLNVYDGGRIVEDDLQPDGQREYVVDFSAENGDSFFNVEWLGQTPSSISGTEYEMVPGRPGSVYDAHDTADTRATETAVPCYCPGTLILTDQGEVPVERLGIGDRLVTAAGAHRPVRWIGRRSYAGRLVDGNRMALPIRFAGGSLGDGLPRRDLWVSPGHAMLVEDQLIHAYLLVNGVSITQAEAVGTVTYLNVELDDHDIILAEGVPAESFHDNGIRNVFANAAEFRTLYPDDPGPGLPCLPLLEQGFTLEAIRRRLDARAGIVHPVPGAPGPLRGYVDVAGPDKVCGWAQDEGHPEEPVRLDVLVEGRRVLRILANKDRADLHAAGLGSGRHAFEVRLPGTCRGVVAVRRTADGALLPMTGLAREALATAA